MSRRHPFDHVPIPCVSDVEPGICPRWGRQLTQSSLAHTSSAFGYLERGQEREFSVEGTRRERAAVQQYDQRVGDAGGGGLLSAQAQVFSCHHCL